MNYFGKQTDTGILPVPDAYGNDVSGMDAINFEIATPYINEYGILLFKGIEENGDLIPKTESEVAAENPNPAIVKSRKQVLSEIMDEYGPTFIVDTLMSTLTADEKIDFKFYADQNSHDGWTLAAIVVDGSALTAEVKTKIKEIMGVS